MGGASKTRPHSTTPSFSVPGLTNARKMEEISSPLTHASFVLEMEDASSVTESERSISHHTISSEGSIPDQLAPEVESPLPEQTRDKDSSNVHERRQLSDTAQQAELLYAKGCVVLRQKIVLQSVHGKNLAERVAK